MKTIIRTYLIVLMMCWLSMFPGTAVKSAAQKIDEAKAAKIKAGILYHLLKLVTWPEHRFESQDAPIQILFLGEDLYGIGEYFELQAPSLTAGGRQIQVKRFARVESGNVWEALRRSHILFLLPSSQHAVAELLQFIEHKAVLTIGDTQQFTEEGGMVGFDTEGGRIRILVNLTSVQRAGIQIGAQFLQHAQIVENDS